MVKRKPRINVSCDSDTFLILSELAEALNVSNSALVNQILSDSKPYMQDLTKVLNSAKAQSGGNVKTIIEIAHKAYSDTLNLCLNPDEGTQEIHPEKQKTGSGRSRLRKIIKP